MRDRGFDVLKVLAIGEVAVAHFLEPLFPAVWAPTAVSLLIFAYSSAYFTRRSYGLRFDRRAYWGRKARRLGIRLLAVDALLLVLFLVQGRSGVWTWQSLVCAAGLQGWLNWLHLPNPSPFGRGMWFLTLLFVFYALYPWIARVLGVGRRPAFWLTLGWCAAAWALEKVVPYGHALWLTTCGFIIGTYAGGWGLPIGRKEGAIGFVGLAAG
ncbi:acyltransferase family protein, partial [Deferrisoma palaeochoriense]